MVSMTNTTLYPETETERAAVHSRLIRGNYHVHAEISGAGYSGPERRGLVSYSRGASRIDVVNPPR